MRIVTFIGYRGSGKTSVAARLGGRLGWPWYDCDAEIERRAGQTIRAIFRNQGEPEFRKLEREVLHDVLARDRAIVAAGGGAVLDENSRREMCAAGPVVWLRASVEQLERRIQADPATSDRRPNLTAGGGRDEIERLFAVREPLYRQCATIVVETDGLSIDQVAETVLRSLDVTRLRGAEP